MFREYNISRIIYRYRDEIRNLTIMENHAKSAYEKELYLEKIDSRTKTFINLMNQFLVYAQETSDPFKDEIKIDDDEGVNNDLVENSDGVRVFTLEELSQYDGKEGRRAYVAVSGVVYDVTDKLRWSGGNHFGLIAGRDLSVEFLQCHIGLEFVLEDLPQIGVLIVEG